MAAQATSQFPAWFAGKPFLTGGNFVIEVKSQAGLLAAEFQSAPGSWKLFPYTAAGEAAAAAWAGVADPGAGGSPGEGVQAPEAAASVISTTAGLVGKAGKFLDDLTSSAFWIRIAEVVAGLVLLAIGANHLFASKPLSAVAKAAGKAAPLALA